MYQAVASVVRTVSPRHPVAEEFRKRKVVMSDSVTEAPSVTEQFLRARSVQASLIVLAAPECSTLPLDRSVACRWTR